MNNFIYLENNENKCSYTPIQGFTLVDIGLEKGNNISNIVMKIENNDSKVFLDSFNEIWKDKNKVKKILKMPLKLKNIFKIMFLQMEYLKKCGKKIC